MRCKFTILTMCALIAALMMVILVFEVGTGSTEQQMNILDSKFKEQMLIDYFRRMSRPRPPVYASKEQWDKRCKELRRITLRCLGLDPLPERVPLNARIVATKEYADYRLERVWYQTLPDVWASGWIYVPKKPSAAKVPAILNPHGHWEQGARAPVVQSRCIALAKKGYVAFAVDSVHVTHWPIGVCSVGMMTWNNMRALDYLETRPEVDASRIGCTGESGGGQQTMYLMATDDRIKVAVPVVLISYFERILFPTEQTHCICNHVPALLRYTDEPELTAIFAPRPTLYISVTGDWTAQFPKDEYPHIRAVYESLKASERVDARQYDSQHDYNKTMREWMYAWFNRWLLENNDAQIATEPDIKTETPEALTRMDSPPSENKGADGIIRYFLRRNTFHQPQVQSSDEWESFRKEFRKQLMNLLGEDLIKPHPLKPSTSDIQEWRGYRMQRVTFESEPGITIPAYVLLPNAKPGRAPAVIALAPHGKEDLLQNYPALVTDLLERGRIILAPDIRFRGELQIKWDLNTVIWGRPEAGMAAHDVRSAADYLRQRADIAKGRISLIGLGEVGATALISGVVDRRIAAIGVTDLGSTYRGGREYPIIPQLLRHGDLPQIAALLVPRRLWLNGAANPGEFEFLLNAYLTRHAADSLQMHNFHTTDALKSLANWI